MARTLWCLNLGCGSDFGSVAGELPATCPTCRQRAHWSTVEQPRVAWALTTWDRRYLALLHVASGDDVPWDDDDGA